MQRLQDLQVAVEAADLPFPLERFVQPTQVPGGLMHIRFADFDVVKANQRIEVDLPGFGGFAHDLPVNLAGLRNVDHHVGQDFRRAGQAPTLGKLRPPSEPELRLADRCQARSRRTHPVLGELALGDQHLAPTAKSAATADRLDVHAKRPRGLEHGRTDWEAAALA